MFQALEAWRGDSEFKFWKNSLDQLKDAETRRVLQDADMNNCTA